MHCFRSLPASAAVASVFSRHCHLIICDLLGMLFSHLVMLLVSAVRAARAVMWAALEACILTYAVRYIQLLVLSC